MRKSLTIILLLALASSEESNGQRTQGSYAPTPGGTRRYGWEKRSIHTHNSLGSNSGQNIRKTGWNGAADSGIMTTANKARQRPGLAIHKFAKLIEQGKPIAVYGDGTMMRDFTYIDDIINGVVAAMRKCAGFNIYNLGESRPMTVNDLIAEIEKALGKTAIKEYLPPQPGDVERTYADVTKAVNELGYNPATSIQASLAKFVAWLRQNS